MTDHQKELAALTESLAKYEHSIRCDDEAPTDGLALAKRLHALCQRLIEAAAPAPAPGLEREAFETDFRRRYPHMPPHVLSMNASGENYLEEFVGHEWDGWQAHASLAAPAGLPRCKACGVFLTDLYLCPEPMVGCEAKRKGAAPAAPDSAEVLMADYEAATQAPNYEVETAKVFLRAIAALRSAPQAPPEKCVVFLDADEVRAVARFNASREAPQWHDLPLLSKMVAALANVLPFLQDQSSENSRALTLAKLVQDTLKESEQAPQADPRGESWCDCPPNRCVGGRADKCRRRAIQAPQAAPAAAPFEKMWKRAASLRQALDLLGVHHLPEADRQFLEELCNPYVEWNAASPAAPPDTEAGEIVRAKAEGWRSIESAPRDGTECLLLFADGRQAVGAWDSVWLLATNPATEKKQWNPRGAVESDYAYFTTEPIRWMPLLAGTPETGEKR